MKWLSSIFYGDILAIETHTVRISSEKISPILASLQQATDKYEREMIIAALLIYALYLSDPPIADDPGRLIAALTSLADSLAFAVTMSVPFDPKQAN